MHWIVLFIGAYFWNTAYSDWGWNGWVAFFFAVVCVGVILGIWETLFGRAWSMAEVVKILHQIMRKEAA